MARLEKRLEGIGGEWCHGEILNLSGWKTVKYKEADDDIIIQAELTTEATALCACGTSPSEFSKWGFTDLTYISDLPIRRKRVRIYFNLQRRRCPCGKTVQQPLAGIDDRHAMTTRLLEYVQQESLNIFRTLSSIGDEAGRSEQTIRNILIEHGEQLQERRSEQLRKNGFIETPKWIAIDEVQPQRNGEQYCVISDPIGQQVVEILPDNKPRTLEKWLLCLDRDNVEVVTIDMWAPYRAIIRRRLRNARIVVDRYHVHNLLSVALKSVLDVIRNSMTYSEQRRYMRAEVFLLKNDRSLSNEREEDEDGEELPSEKDVVEKWLQDVPDIAKAHELVKDFFDILQLPDRQKAEELTDQWLMRVSDFVEYFRSRYQSQYRGKWQDPFGNVPGTISDWRPYILNYIDFKKRFRINMPNGIDKFLNATNAFAEFANKQIKRAYEDEDVTRDLLDDPKENRGWLARFGPTAQSVSDSKSNTEIAKGQDNPKAQQQPDPERHIVRRPIKHSRDQLKFF